MISCTYSVSSIGGSIVEVDNSASPGRTGGNINLVDLLALIILARNPRHERRALPHTITSFMFPVVHYRFIMHQTSSYEDLIRVILNTSLSQHILLEAPASRNALMQDSAWYINWDTQICENAPTSHHEVPSDYNCLCLLLASMQVPIAINVNHHSCSIQTNIASNWYQDAQWMHWIR